MDWSLSDSLKRIAAVFDLDRLLASHADHQPLLGPTGAATPPVPELHRWVTEYYRQSEVGYRKYHSEQGSIHMAINEGDRFDPAGYYVQPTAIAQEIQRLSAQTVLEVGSGKGFNSRFLATQFPQIQFRGIDLTPRHVALAQHTAQALPNLQFQLGDFNQTGLATESVDLVFGVDCLCHANDLAQVLQELHRVLRPGGRLILFDGYRTPDFEHHPPDLQRAAQLVELGMAVPMGFRTVDTWLQTAQVQGFSTIATTNHTAGILPTLRRLQALSYRFFKRPWRAKLLKLWLPPYLCKNAIAGLLMPFTCDLTHGAHQYHQLVLEKNA